nr:MAG TPA: hypothetical protein [Crassvirales sp.]
MLFAHLPLEGCAIQGHLLADVMLVCIISSFSRSGL